MKTPGTSLSLLMAVLAWPVALDPGPSPRERASIPVLDYQGKYVRDMRLDAVRADLPGMIARARARLGSALGVEVPGDLGAAIRFADAGEEGRGGARARTYPGSVAGRNVTILEFFTEYVVLDRGDFEARLTHELKHALFRHRMGPSYERLPFWVREGLAVYGAGQLEDRMALLLGHALHAGRHPLALLEGLSEQAGRFEDYLEAALAFSWLERRRPGGVALFCEGLLEGAEPFELLALLSGSTPDRAAASIREYASKRIKTALEPGLAAFQRIQEAQAAAGEQADAWLWREGEEAYSDWLETHPGHVLAPYVRFRFGQSLIQAGQVVAGRALLGRLIAEEFSRTSLADEAAYWQVRSCMGRPGEEAALAAAAGVFLRDFSWSRRAGSFRGRFLPAGPVLLPRQESGILPWTRVSTETKKGV